MPTFLVGLLIYTMLQYFIKCPAVASHNIISPWTNAAKNVVFLTIIVLFSNKNVNTYISIIIFLYRNMIFRKKKKNLNMKIQA